MTLLVNRMDDDWSEDYPDEMFEFGSQFMYMSGYDSYLDLDSLMVLLWKMDQRIKELENKQ
ncbi:hypothetical protein EBT25_11710 [bacterium]|jgi:hypothetical protein|nr:hypothetical protein [bacterium]